MRKIRVFGSVTCFVVFGIAGLFMLGCSRDNTVTQAFPNQKKLNILGHWKIEEVRERIAKYRNGELDGEVTKTRNLSLDTSRTVSLLRFDSDSFYFVGNSEFYQCCKRHRGQYQLYNNTLTGDNCLDTYEDEEWYLKETTSRLRMKRDTLFIIHDITKTYPDSITWVEQRTYTNCALPFMPEENWDVCPYSEDVESCGYGVNDSCTWVDFLRSDL